MRRKSTKNTRGPNKIEQDFQAWLKNRVCCISGRYGVEVHHMYGSTFKHNKILIGHLACIPLCYEFHRGQYGIHKIGYGPWVEAHDRQALLFNKQIYDYLEETGIDLLETKEYSAIMDWGR